MPESQPALGAADLPLRFELRQPRNPYVMLVRFAGMCCAPLAAFVAANASYGRYLGPPIFLFGVALIIATALWQRKFVCKALSLDETGVVMEFKNGVKALRWADVEAVLDSPFRDGTNLVGPVFPVFLHWDAQNAEAMLSFAARALHKVGVFADPRYSPESSKVYPEDTGFSCLVEGIKYHMEWENVQAISLETFHPKNDFDAQALGGNVTLPMVLLRVDTRLDNQGKGAKSVRIAALPTILSVYASLMDAYEQFLELSTDPYNSITSSSAPDPTGRLQ